MKIWRSCSVILLVAMAACQPSESSAGPASPVARSACPPNALDLASVELTTGYGSLLESVPRHVDAEDITTHLPTFYTYAVDGYCFGHVALQSSAPEAVPRTQIGVLLSNADERKTVGLKVQLEDSRGAAALLDALTRIHGEPVGIAPVPAPRENGALLGYAAYLWELKEPIFLVHTYTYDTRSRRSERSATLFRLTPDARDSGGGVVLERLRRTYTP